MSESKEDQALSSDWSSLSATSHSSEVLESPGLEVALADVWPVFAMSKQEGIALDEIAERVGLPVDTFDKPEGYLGLADYFRMLGELSLIYQDETCHMSDRPMLLGTTQFALDQMSTCKTLREALYKIAEISNLLNGGPYNQIRESEGLLNYIIDDSRFPYLHETKPFLYCGMECVLILVHGLLSHISTGAGPLPLPYISIKREPDRSARHLKFWRDRIRFQSSTYVITYDERVGDRQIVVPEGGFSSQSLFVDIVNLVKAPHSERAPEAISLQVRRFLLIDPSKDQQQVAGELGMSVATMRRRLKEEATSFRDVRHSALNELATNMLDKGFQAYDVAEKLGFSDLRSFSRAFKGWHGITPSEYRSNQN